MATQNFPHTPRRPSNTSSLSPSFIPSLRKSSGNSTITPKLSNQSLASSINSSSQPSPSPSSSAFRSIRSLLPFGQSKSSQQHQNVTRMSMDEGGSSGGFFGSMKRSMSKEGRRDSGVGMRSAYVEPPVINIHASNGLSLDDTVKQYRNGSLGSNSSLSVPRFDEFGVIKELSSSPKMSDLPARLPSPSLGPDLSTILEADTSGASLSKHLPDRSHDSSFDAEGAEDNDEPTISMPLPSTSQTIPSPSPHLSSPPLRREKSALSGSSALDFDEIPGQVRDALQSQQKAIVSEWLNDTSSVLEQEQNEDLDLDLGALDADLARILGPNPKSPIESGPLQSAHGSGRVIGLQSTPSRRALSTSLPKPTPSLTRLRSPNLYTTPIISKTIPTPSPEADASFVLKEPIDLTMSRRASLDSNPQRRRSIAPPSPLSASPSSPPQSESRQSDSLRRASITARLATPRNLSLRRPNWSHLLPDGSSSAIDVSQLERSPTSVSQRAATDVDAYTDVDASDLTFRNRAFLHGAIPTSRTRKRSASVDQRNIGKHFNGYLPPSLPRGSLDRPSSSGPRVSSESGRPTMEWLGPRTAKAFAAAGLLDTEKQSTPRLQRGSEPSSISPAARYASVRSMGERGYGGGSQYSPSRSSDDVMSQPGSTMSWSRTNATSAHSHGLMESPTLTSTTPRTNFSGSTAPTSVISPSPTTDYLEIQALRDKHAMETEALFSALSDAQRQAKLLREENHQLRTRIALLEEEVDANRKIIDGYRTSMMGPPQPRYQALEPADMVTPRRPVEFGGRLTPQTVQRPRGASFQATSLSRPTSMRFATPSAETKVPLPSETSFQSATPGHRRRESAASSIFPTVPSNMTMLVHERVDRTGLDISSSFQQTTREVGNGSPDTVNYSMTTTGGSPKSLSLRPEHEAHLGDMDALSLNMSYRDEGGSTHGSGWS